MLAEDLQVREYLKTKLKNAAVSRILIERPAKNARITIFSARPGVVIGKKGEDIENLKAELGRRLGVPVAVNIEEVRKPEIDAQLIADSITQQLEKRIMFRRAMKRAMQNAMRLGAQGIKIMSAGRLNGIEIARCEWYREGRVPLHTLKADIDYGFSEAKTTYGVIGVKVWVYRGDRLANGEAPAIPKTEGDDDRRRVVARARVATVRVPAVAAGRWRPWSAYRRRAGRRAGGTGRCGQGPRPRRQACPSRRPGGWRRDQRRITMLQPARRKFRKEQKGRNTGIATRGANVSFGEFGLKATERGRITARQIEAARRAISRHIKRGGRIFIRIFPDKPISQKPAEVRMGNGKGNPEYYVAEIVPGKVLYEINGVPGATGARSVHAGRRQAAAAHDLRRPPGRRLIGDKHHESIRTAHQGRGGAREGDHRSPEGPFRPAHAEGHAALSNNSQLGKTRRDIARAKTILAKRRGPPNERRSRQEHPHAGGSHRQRQARQDRHRADRAPHRARALRQDRGPFAQVPRPRRKGRVQDGRHGRDRRRPSDQQDQVLGRDPPGREGQAGLTPRWGLPQRPCRPRPDAGYSRAGRSR
jgi:ribosomal protein S3/ribosomal protein L16